MLVKSLLNVLGPMRQFVNQCLDNAVYSYKEKVAMGEEERYVMMSLKGL